MNWLYFFSFLSFQFRYFSVLFFTIYLKLKKIVLVFYIPYHNIQYFQANDWWIKYLSWYSSFYFIFFCFTNNLIIMLFSNHFNIYITSGNTSCHSSTPFLQVVHKYPIILTIWTIIYNSYMHARSCEFRYMHPINYVKKTNITIFTRYL